MSGLRSLIIILLTYLDSSRLIAAPAPPQNGSIYVPPANPLLCNVAARKPVKEDLPPG